MDYNKENLPKLLSCMQRGPGPAYKLPSLVGYRNHDMTRRREPAYTLRKRLDPQIKNTSPGPGYNTRNFTNFGRENPPAFTICFRERYKHPEIIPGPGAYAPERCPPVNHNKRPPAYTIGTKNCLRSKNIIPAPNAYRVPTCIGPKIPDKQANGAFTIIGERRVLNPECVGPGPAAYAADTKIVKRRPPAFTISRRHEKLSKEVVPGPDYYPLYNTKRVAPKFSFGLKHSQCEANPITPLDTITDE